MGHPACIVKIYGNASKYHALLFLQEQYQGCYDFVYEYVDKVNQDSAVFTHL